VKHNKISTFIKIYEFVGYSGRKHLPELATLLEKPTEVATISTLKYCNKSDIIHKLEFKINPLML
jgi:hypothetical protein